MSDNYNSSDDDEGDEDEPSIKLGDPNVGRRSPLNSPPDEDEG